FRGVWSAFISNSPRSILFLSARSWPPQLLADRPEIVGQVAVREVGIRDREITLHAPVRAPGVAYREALGGVVVTDRAHRVAADRAFAGRRQTQHAGLRHCRRFETLIDGEAEHERKTLGQARAHLGYRLEAVIGADPVLLALRIAGR